MTNMKIFLQRRTSEMQRVNLHREKLEEILKRDENGWSKSMNWKNAANIKETENTNKFRFREINQNTSCS